MIHKNAALPLALLLAACAAQADPFMTEQTTQDAPTPPVADKRPVEITQHGVTRTDEYAWMRDDDWQEVLRDPSVLRADIREHLEAEVAYYDAMTKDLEPLRKRLFAEMRGRIKEDESSVPMPDGPYAYYVRYREGGEYPIYARTPRDGGAEEILLDGDKEGEGADFFDIGGVDASNDHDLLAVSTDRVGSEYYEIEIRTLEGEETYPEKIGSTDGGVVWSADSKSFFYVERDDNQRPKRVKHHVLGTDPASDRLVYEEADDAMFLGIDETTSRKFMVIGVGNGVTSEARVVPLDGPEAEPRLIAERIHDQLYDVDHREGRFYIHTNADGAVDFKIVSAPEDAPGRENWTDWLPYEEGTYVTGMETYKDWLVRAERKEGKPRIVVSNYDKEGHEITFDEAAYALSLGGWGEYDTDVIRFGYESPSQPAQVFDYDMKTRERTLRKTQEVPSGHDPDLYAVDALTAVGEDGAEIPVTVLRLKSAPLDGSAPLMLYGYGSYGAYIPDDFSTAILSLVDRGMPFALAHIRGGSAKGRQWYLDGKLAKKENTFRDFNAAARMLIDEGYTAKGKIAAYGGSAGGLLVGAAVNLDPSLYGVVLGAVPFVDVVSTISDASLPLTPPEWDEWGDPIKDPEAYKTIAAYSPYDNVREGVTYPPILATGGLADYRVTYWEPAKWIARLRDRAEGGPFLLRMNMSAGHGGSAARFERLEERAHLYAYALDRLGLKDAEPVKQTAPAD
ncbi:S9 family peptidase [Parvularcula dongshanensis]|uniref:Oligopeptidase B n=1 Tax=Parvularcula dongshanensis TaxID=1173995 RepID=A0A840I094_9PROT|nr:S9 family peptidase [Parvularcula dongshanensis]MBB4658117.1 oligopeptidase B [Parvularcula dongshanensis]